MIENKKVCVCRIYRKNGWSIINTDFDVHSVITTHQAPKDKLTINND